MKNEQAETKFKPAFCLARHLITLPIFGFALLGLIERKRLACAFRHRRDCERPKGRDD
jgi:hypothetical protein